MYSPFVDTQTWFQPSGRRGRGSAGSLGPTLTTRILLTEEKCYYYQRSDDLTTPYIEYHFIAIMGGGTGGCFVKINMMYGSISFLNVLLPRSRNVTGLHEPARRVIYMCMSSCRGEEG